MKRWRLWLCLTIILVLLIAIPSRNTANLLETLSKSLPLLVDNQSIGLLFSQGLEKQYGLANDPQGSTRVQKIGQRLLSKIETKQKYDFAILQSSDFNACSIYGGHIRVFKGLLTDTQNSDNELAAVLAHELAHNELGHNKEAVKQFKIAYALDLANISNKMPALLLAGANAVLAKRSRQHEKAADQQALEWMAEAGFNPKGAIAVYRRIEAEHNIEKKRSGGNALQQRFSQIFATHPEPASRCDMAEDYLFTQKYGRTFKEVLGESTSNSGSYYGDSLVIVAHPSLWQSSLRVTNKICGVGIFNPSPLSIESVDVDFFLNVCANDHLIAVTCDNDSHDVLEKIGIPDKATDNHFTFIEGDYADPGLLMTAIREGKTYASATGVELKDMNFPIGRNYPKVNYPKFTFKATSGYQTFNLSRVIVYRDGEKWIDRGITERGIGIINRDGSYTIEDKDVKAGEHWYVIYSPGTIITSPITLTVTKDSDDPIDLGGSDHWQKGCIHYHSFYSDGGSKSIQEIWDSGRENSVGFIFMTDHADRITQDGDHAFSRYAADCKRASSAMVPGVEYSLRKKDTGYLRGNHILILNPKEWKEYKEMEEEVFFNDEQVKTPEKLLILQGPVHLGDDVENSQIEEDAVFDYGPNDATVKLRVKGTPFKDPILWINRQEIGRVVTTDNQWHWFEFTVPKGLLRNGRNLFHIESYIPDRWKTFDDCEIADVYILKK